VDLPVGNGDFPFSNVVNASFFFLLGGAITILKNMSSSMGRMKSHILWKIKAMFETTNQFCIASLLLSSKRNSLVHPSSYLILNGSQSP
jgi:hypothetical protein